MKKAVLLQACNLTPVLKASRHHGQISLVLSRSLMNPPRPTPWTDINLPSYGNPCLDLFFHVKRPKAYSDESTRASHNFHALNYLKQLLPMAWSHDALTTLKLIYNLKSGKPRCGKWFDEGFYAAVFWLHRNHPKTLVRMVDSIADFSGNLYNLVWILHALLLQEHDGHHHDNNINLNDKGTSDFALRYERDPEYKLLYDRAMDVFVERLQSDIEKMKQNKLELKPSDFTTDDDDDDDDDDDRDDDDDDDDDDESVKLDPEAYSNLKVTPAAEICVTESPPEANAIRAILLRESVRKRLFPAPDQSESEDQWERLWKEVLVPLEKYHNRQGEFIDRQRCPMKKYLAEVKADNDCIRADALLPHLILRFVKDEGYGEAAELQWKAMVEDVKKSGKFKNCLAVCDITSFMGERTVDMQVALALLVSQLNEEPWKGKVIATTARKTPNCKLSDPFVSPQLHSIQGHDLKSQSSFLRGMNSEMALDIQKLFDMILEVAVNENVKPEQMIDKVFVFTNISRPFIKWETEYEAIRNKFKEKGYGDDAVPHILFWNIWNLDVPWMEPPAAGQHPWVTELTSFSDNLVKSFLDNGGEIAPHHLMEASIADQPYQTLTVVD